MTSLPAAPMEGSVEIVHETQEASNPASKNLRKWSSNATEAQQTFESKYPLLHRKERFIVPAETEVRRMICNPGVNEFSFSGEHLTVLHQSGPLPMTWPLLTFLLLQPWRESSEASRRGDQLI